MGVAAVKGSARAVFFDRDGVLNEAIVRNGKPYSPSSTAELTIPANVRALVGRVKSAGFLAIGVTNQPDVAHGRLTLESATAVNEAVRSATSLDALLACYHADEDRCLCRKPAPGMLDAAAARFDIDLSQSVMIGDRWRDVEAGRRATCRTVFIDYNYQEAKPMPPADATVRSLEEGVTWILSRTENPERSHLVPRPSALRIKLFADGADRAGMLEMYRNPLIRGFTTNPTLMRKAGITDYPAFAREILAAIPNRPISFEVFSDEFDDMERQAMAIAGWGEHVYVKIPISNTHQQSSIPLIGRLAKSGVKVNVTAVMTLRQVNAACQVLAGGPAAVVSVFAGRIADTGRDPVPMMAAARELTRMTENVELLWASPRELLNVFQANDVGCDIITATNDILKKLDFVGKNLDEFSLDTVKMFRNDALAAGFTL